MNAITKFEAVNKFAGQGFIKNLVVKLLIGEKRDISPLSALRLRIGRLIWGRSTGLATGPAPSGKPISLPDEIFYEIADRSLPAAGAIKQAVMDNLVRAQMCQIEARVLKAVMVILFLLSAGAGVAVVFGEQIVQNFHGFHFGSARSTSISRLSPIDREYLASVAFHECANTNRFNSNQEVNVCVDHVLTACENAPFGIRTPENREPPNPCLTKAAGAYAISLN